MAESMGRKGILIVEDEYLLAMDIRMTLEESGYTVAGIAMSGEEAMEQVEKERPGLLLMDIKLHGGSDGIETARRAVDRFGTQVIFLSGNIDSATLERAREAKPLGFLHKPLEEHELLALLDKVFNR